MMRGNNQYEEFLANITLPIIKHSAQAKEPCYIIIARLTRTEPIIAKTNEGIIKGIIGPAEVLEYFKKNLANTHIYPFNDTHSRVEALETSKQLKADTKIALIECDEPTLLWSYICYKRNPNLPANRICITGTNGKTSTSWFIYQLLCFMKRDAMLIGSIGIFENGKKISNVDNTTPDAEIIHEYANVFAQKFPNGFLILETSSIALHQHRAAFIKPQVSIWTNFSHEHLDYHKTLDEYKKSKMQLGAMSQKFFIHNLVEQNEYEKYGTQLIKATQKENLEIELLIDATNIKVSCGIFGTFQAQNILSAIIALKEYVDLNEIIPNLDKLTAPAGRMQKIYHNNRTILIDNAHKQEALKHALDAINECKKPDSKTLVVCGCGGDRDKQKRPVMGRIMQELANIAIITSDNPRSEDASTIAQEMLNGCVPTNLPQIIIDRKEAIKAAIEAMNEHDILLIAGKGEETEQVFADHAIEFNDYEVAQELLKSC